jgi:aspartate/methionine/tyrosine aminotransferase
LIMATPADRHIPVGEPMHTDFLRIDLSGADLGLATPAHVREAAKRALDEGATHYTTRPGLDSLRQAVAAKLAHANGIMVKPDGEVLITCGSQEALFITLHVLLNPGDHVLIPQPANPAYAALARQAHGRVFAVPGDPAHGFALDVAGLARRVTKRTRMLVFASPASPAGTVVDEANLQRIADFAIAHDLLVVADESLEPFVYDGAVHRSIASLPGMAERTVTINGFSHPYAMHGWRVGYVAGPARLLAPITQLKQALSICSPAVSQYAAVAAIEGSQAPVAEALQVAAERRSCAVGALTEAGIPHIRPAAGLDVLVDARALQRTGADLARWVARHSNVVLGSGAVYCPSTASWLRLGLTHPAPVIREAVGRLGPLYGSSRMTEVS